MFVLRSKYDSLDLDHTKLEMEYYVLLTKWNDLVELINKKGGQDFLNSNISQKEFSKSEIKDLIILCHPDKHKGSKKAEEITKKLLQLR